jgi:HK97 family phage prohead protease
MTIYNRSFPTDPTVEGRTLTGMALYWDRASKVTDDGRDYYLEAFSTRSTDKQLNERGSKPFALGFLHPWSTGAADKRPLGAVTFNRSAEGLVFEAKLSKTRAADEMLELVNDGVVTDVSIGFQSYKTSKRGEMILRTEIGIRELSLAPTGMGQHDGAQVLAVRANEDELAVLARLNRSKQLAALKLWLPY